MRGPLLAAGMFLGNMAPAQHPAKQMNVNTKSCPQVELHFLHKQVTCEVMRGYARGHVHNIVRGVMRPWRPAREPRITSRITPRIIFYAGETAAYNFLDRPGGPEPAMETGPGAAHNLTHNPAHNVLCRQDSRT